MRRGSGAIRVPGNGGPGRRVALLLVFTELRMLPFWLGVVVDAGRMKEDINVSDGAVLST